MSLRTLCGRPTVRSSRVHPVHIRLAEAKDATNLARLRLRLFQEIQPTVTADESRFVPECTRAYLRLFELAGGRVWVAEAEGGEIVSTLTVLERARLPTPTSPKEREGYVVGVYTVPTWRRRGLASDLLRTAIDDARAEGLARLRLHATDLGRLVYARVGFTDRPGSMEHGL